MFQTDTFVYKIKRVIACSECDISLTYLLKHNPVHKIKRITKSHLGNRNKLERHIKPSCRGQMRQSICILYHTIKQVKVLNDKLKRKIQPK